MVSCFNRKIPWLFLIVAVVCAAIYYPGLSSGYYFDDYGQIVMNDALRFPVLNWDNFYRAAFSSSAGPLGRPVVMATIAVEMYFWGDGPEHFKWVNLSIHLLNGALVAWLLWMIMDAASEKNSSVHSGRLWLVIAPTAWWMLHPINVTSVLYVVQRMTSLSATFSLLGLTTYVYFRKKSIHNPKKGFWLRGLAGLMLCTAASVYSKENGMITPVYAWLIEMLIFNCQVSDAKFAKVLKGFLWLLPVGAVLAGAGYLWLQPDWAIRVYAGRPFSLDERLMTESRVLWFYVRQLLLPASSIFSLYLDDFLISQSLLQPWTTLLSIICHLVVFIFAIFTRCRLPLISLGIAWFYVGHSVESTIIPLELAFEHRNYLPGLGILVAAVAAADHVFATRKEWFRHALHVLIVGVVLLCIAITWQRSVSMSDFFGYPVLDAERHPSSSRANFDAGMVLTNAIAANPDLAADYAPRVQMYLERSIQANENTLAPFIALLRLSHVMHEPLSDQILVQFEERLRNGIPPNSTGFIARSLGDRLAETPPLISYEKGEQLYKAALDNPRLVGYSRTVWLAGYAMFVSNIMADRVRGQDLMRQAVTKSPSHGDLHILLAAMLLDSGQLDEASLELDQASRVDKGGYLDGAVQKLRQEIEKKRNAKN